MVGGEFEISSVKSKPFKGKPNVHIPQGGVWTLSGRAAFAIILKEMMAHGVSHVHLPSFLCVSLVYPVKELGLNYSFYPVDFSLAAHPDPPDGAAVLLIHYFGWLNPSTERLRSEAGGSFQLIEDFSHAFLSTEINPWNNNSHIFFSARKIGPISLGGWCSRPAALELCNDTIECLYWRSLAARFAKHIYLSDINEPIDQSVEDFYLEAFHYVEQFLDKNLLMHTLPVKAFDMITGLDWDNIKEKRRNNWLYVKDAIQNSMDILVPDLSSDTVPLGMVLLVKDRDLLRRNLSEHRIFCPIHWALPKEVFRSDFPDASYMSDHCITIPIDQRYDKSSLDRVVDLIKRFN
jgi:hypothetical protein